MTYLLLPLLGCLAGVLVGAAVGALVLLVERRRERRYQRWLWSVTPEVAEALADQARARYASRGGAA